MKISVIVPSLDGNVPMSLPKDDPRLEIVVVKGVSPVAAARNQGLAQATGQYIAWVDADDEVVPEWFDAIWEALQDGPDIVSFDVRAEWHDGSGRKAYRLDGRAADQLWCKVFKRELFNGLKFEGVVHEDWRIQCQMRKDVRMVHVAKELYVYKRTRNGLSQHRDAVAEFKALWGLVKICNSWSMVKGIWERFFDFAKTPLRRMLRK